MGSKYGDCCSQYSYCGSTSEYCGTGCQAGFGKCNPSSSSNSASRTSSSTHSSSSSRALSTTSTVTSFSSSSVSSPSSASSSVFSSASSSASSSAYSSSLTTSSDSSTSASTSSSASQSSTTSSDSTTSTSLALSVTSSATASVTPTPSSNSLCGIEGYDIVDFQVFGSTSFTTTADCLATCQQDAACGSVIVYTGTCYKARLSVTPERVVATPGTGLVFYDRSCGPSVVATSTASATASSASTPTPTVCPAPTFTCVPYPTCPQFTSPLTSACPAQGGMCNNNYFTRCSQAPAVGSQVIAQLGNTVAGGDGCRLACNARDNCAAFVFSTTSPAGQICDLYATLNGFSSSFVDTYLRICPTTC